MARRNPLLLPIAALALVGIVVVIATREDPSIARLPQGLSTTTADPSGWDKYAFQDGSGRTLTTADGEHLRIDRQNQHVETPLEIQATRLLGLTRDNRAFLMVAELPTDTKLHVGFVRRGVVENSEPPQNFPLTFPDTVQKIHDGVLSPDGSQIAWSLTSAYDIPGIGLLRRIVPSLAARFPPHRNAEVWLSDVQGGHLRQVVTSDKDGDQVPITLGWNPTDKTLVMGYEKKNYRLP